MHPWGGGGDGVSNKFKSTKSGATKPVQFLLNERTNYEWFPQLVMRYSGRLLLVPGGVVQVVKGTA